MKKIIATFVIVLCLAGSYKVKSQISTGISFNTFYTQLSPYGRWINNPDYGQVWIANVNDFEPYSNNGHWEFTNYGWTWVSDYDWGWAPFHYGRWAYVPVYGWAWVPGYEWAPAWVSWCQYDGYYGWAPLSPGMGFSTGFGNIPYNNWRFVRYQYINNSNINRHFSRPVIQPANYNNVTIINNTQVNNNITYAAGPAQQDVEKVTRKKIAPRQVAFSEEGVTKTQVANNQIRIYRPDSKKIVENPQPVKREEKEQVVSPVVSDSRVSPLPVKQTAPKQPATEQPLPVKKQQEQAETRLPKKPVQQEQLIQQQEIKKQEAIRQQREAADRENKQVEIRKQQEAAARQQQLNNQRAAEQQRLQQQNEQPAQQAQQAEQRRQQQEQMRQQKMQQQEMRRQEREQRALPVQQPAPASKPAQQPARPNRKN